MLLFIFLGGGLGSVLRFLISGYTQKLWNIGAFPVGTFVVNIAGCFLMGLMSAYFLKGDQILKYLFIAGFCGGFTTFSAFAAENFQLYQNGFIGVLLLNITLSVLFGVVAVWAGMRTVELL